MLCAHAIAQCLLFLSRIALPFPIGQHPVFLKKAKELEEMRDQKNWAAQKWREYQQENIRHSYEAELKQADDEFKVRCLSHTYNRSFSTQCIKPHHGTTRSVFFNSHTLVLTQKDG